MVYHSSGIPSHRQNVRFQPKALHIIVYTIVHIVPKLFTSVGHWPFRYVYAGIPLPSSGYAISTFLNNRPQNNLNPYISPISENIHLASKYICCSLARATYMGAMAANITSWSTIFQMPSLGSIKQASLLLRVDTIFPLKSVHLCTAIFH